MLLMKLKNLTKPYILALLLLISVVIFIVISPKLTEPANRSNILQNGSMINLYYGEVKINAEIASTYESREKGLMMRGELDESSGMLFVFESSSPRTFWMKDTLIPLDIIFLDENLKVINISENTKPNQTTETYSSTQPALYVLEMNGGWSKKHNLKNGSQLRF
jgi:uncharacterized protein